MIGIIGGGPAGSTLGALLARAGKKVIMFNPSKRPELIVGESLLPAIIPILQQLGVEEKVAEFSVHKPGATVTLNKDESVSAFFKDAKGNLPPYAYNTPRNLFDQVILDQAIQDGVHLIDGIARVDAVDGKLRLSEESVRLAGEFLQEQPDFMVDATGRSRYFSRLMGLEYSEGKRKDTALFAHFDHVALEEKGNIHVDHLEKGWAWRIPLQGKVSLGIVQKEEHLNEFGTTAEKQFDAFIQTDPFLKSVVGEGKRLTNVMKYNNYQLESHQLSGKNWACIGDAAGFLDPVFSTGLYLAMKSAVKLSEVLLSPNYDESMAEFNKNWHWELNVWRKIIGSWYDGRLFTLYRAGRKQEKNPVGRIIAPHVEKHLSRIFTGDAISTGSYSRNLHAFLTKYMLMGEDPDELRVL